MLLWRPSAAPASRATRTSSSRSRFPLAAGLGGGSADAAAALVGSQHRLGRAGNRGASSRASAPTLGSDVPFFLHGGTALGSGPGRRALSGRRQPSVRRDRHQAVLRRADGRRLPLARRRSRRAPARTRPLCAAGRSTWAGRPVRSRSATISKAPVARRHPGSTRWCRPACAKGRSAAAMTGSGSAVFGVFSEAAATQGRQTA